VTRRLPRSFATLGGVLLAAALAVAVGERPPASHDAAARVARRHHAAATDRAGARLPGRVVQVIDGDTVVVQLDDGAREHVRLIGLDTPELHESAKLDRDAARSHERREAIQVLGARARDVTAAALDGRRVELELDVEVRDRYGRLLAWIWTADGTLFNETLVRDGWARLYTFPPNVRHVDALRAAQADAQAARRGFWGDPHPPWTEQPRGRTHRGRGRRSSP